MKFKWKTLKTTLEKETFNGTNNKKKKMGPRCWKQERHELMGEATRESFDGNPSQNLWHPTTSISTAHVNRFLRGWESRRFHYAKEALTFVMGSLPKIKTLSFCISHRLMLHSLQLLQWSPSPLIELKLFSLIKEISCHLEEVCLRGCFNF